MSAMGEYLFTIVAAALFVSVLQILVTKKTTVSTVIKLVSGIFLLYTVVSPLVAFRVNDTIEHITDIENDASLLIADACISRDDEIRSVIKQNAEAYVLDKALVLGANIQVELTVQNESPYLPEKITLTGAVSPLIKKQLTSVIEKDIGLPEELQIWKLA